ncbi:substrate-binding domain-containing protein [Pseudonocardia benzenivorans]
MRFLASSSRARIVAAALAAAAAVVLAGCSPAPSSPSGGAAAGPSGTTGAATSAAGDITPYCPSEPTKIVFIKSAGGQVWSAIANAEFEAEAAKCPNIQASWYNGTSGVQGAIAATNAAVAQGAKALVVIADFGAAQLPSLRKAVQSGVTVVTTVSDGGAQRGTDVTDSLLWDVDSIGENQAKWLDEHIRTGKVAFLGGQPGAPSTETTFNAFKAALSRYAPESSSSPTPGSRRTGTRHRSGARWRAYWPRTATTLRSSATTAPPTSVRCRRSWTPGRRCRPSSTSVPRRASCAPRGRTTSSGSARTARPG